MVRVRDQLPDGMTAEQDLVVRWLRLRLKRRRRERRGALITKRLQTFGSPSTVRSVPRILCQILDQGHRSIVLAITTLLKRPQFSERQHQ